MRVANVRNRIDIMNISHVQTDENIADTDKELSASLEYIFKKTTEEVLKFNDKKAVVKIGVMKDGVLLCRDSVQAFSAAY